MLSPRNRDILLVAAVVLLSAHHAWAEDSAVANAVAALQHGDASSAEQILRTELKTHPNEPAALEVLAVVLDQEKKLSDADEIYRRALSVLPQSPGLLNNYGNHLLSMEKPKEARAEFLKVVALQPGQPNATIQLARIALELKQPDQAERYLSQLDAETLQRPDVIILRMQTAYALHRTSLGDKLFEQLSAAAAGKAQDDFRLAVALSSVGEYDKAETLFAKVVELQPDNIEALYDLGLSASHAGHDERARDVLHRVLEKEPENVDVLSDLAAVDSRLNDNETALEFLVQAHQLAPRKAGIESALARTAAELGYFGDAAKAWEAYTKLAPADDTGRREEAFAETAIGENASAVMADLLAYVRKHPADPVGHYELGTSEITTDQQKAVQQLNRALELKPDLAPAHMARGLLYYRQGNFAAALKDFAAAAQSEPRNAAVLDRLGETYLALNRTADAVRVLQRAEQIAPENTTLLLHLGRALTAEGDRSSAEQAFARYRALGGARSTLPHPAGLLDFLSLSPDEQHKRYATGVLRTVKNDPDNIDAEIRYLGLLLDDGNGKQAAATVDKIISLHPDTAHLEETCSELLNADDYAQLAKLIKGDASNATLSSSVQIDLAIATLHIEGPEKARAVIDSVPASARNADYDLARAAILDAASQPHEADEALQKALHGKPKRPDLYRETAVWLLSKHQLTNAQALLDASVKDFSDDPRLRLLQTLTNAISGNGGQNNFQALEQLWPEWGPVWMAQALAFEATGRHSDALIAVREALARNPADSGLQHLAALIQTGSAKEKILSSVDDLFT